jgi:3-dehydroquinate synthase
MIDIKSGTGEIIKVHAISGYEDFNKMAADYDLVISNKSVLSKYIKSALNIKKKYIEQDEFDTGSRLIFNYGHSFGHAIESASNFSIPHGIAVSMGMDIANHVAVAFKMLPKFHADRMHPVLRKNYENSIGIKLDQDNIFDALSKDKKNSSNKLRVVTPVGENAEIKLVEIAPDNYFKKILEASLNTING